MKKALNILLAVICLFAALSIGLQWHRGEQATTSVWLLAIIGALEILFNAIERVFPSLRD
jgi:hypothetical protein